MAKQNISTLNIKVTASSEGVRKGLGKAKGELRGFRAGAVSAMKGITIAAAATAAAVAGIVMVAVKLGTKLVAAASAFDEIVKRARALNVEVAKLEAVQFLAEFSGADATKAGMALERLAISIGDATDGTGEAAEAFKKLGLNIDALKSQDVVDSMEDIGRALARIDNRAEQLDILSKIVGSRQAGRLINTFEAMAGGLGTIEDLTEAIGLNLTKIQADEIEEMNDAIFLAKQTSVAFWRQLSAELAPAIKESALAAAEFLAQLRPWIPTIARTIETVASLAKNLNPFLWAMRGVVAMGRKLGFTMEHDVADKFRKAHEPIKVASEELEGIPGLTAGAAEAYKAMAEAAAKAADELAARVSAVVEAAKSPMEKLGDEIRDIGEIWSSIPFERHGSVIDMLADKWERVLGPIKETAAMVADGAIGGADARSQAGMSAVNQAARNRRDQLSKARAEEETRKARDARRDDILRAIRAELAALRGDRTPPIKVKEVAIVG